MKELRTSVGCELPADFGARRLYVSANGTHVAVTGAQGVMLLDAASLSTRSVTRTQVWNSAAFDPTGRIFLVCNEDNVQAIEVETGKVIGKAKGPTEFFCDLLTFSPSGDTAFMTSIEDGTLTSMDVTPAGFGTSRSLAIPDEPGQPIVAPDGEHVYLVTWDQLVYKISTANPARFETLRIPSYPRDEGVILANSGRNLIVAGIDGTITSARVSDMSIAWVTRIADEGLQDSDGGESRNSQILLAPDGTLIYFGYVAKVDNGHGYERERDGFAVLDAETGDIHRKVPLEVELSAMSNPMILDPENSELLLFAGAAIRSYDLSTLEPVAETRNWQESLSTLYRDQGFWSGQLAYCPSKGCGRFLMLRDDVILSLELSASSATVSLGAPVQGERRIMLELPE